ncbi:MAG TPA: 30S ribosomal protein S3 [Planctomycetota bacterium]|nr:30S ribosomal protein S3 [Planctomycetota bacterium]
MGQKARPIGLRIGIVENWRSRWFAGKKDFGNYLVEDQKLRKFLTENYRFAAIAMVEIERTRGETTVILHTARPGIIIGRKGQEVDRMKARLEEIARDPVNIKIQEISQPELSAQLIAESIRDQLEKRASFRRTVKRAIETIMDNGAQGAKVRLAGRIGGSDMARVETQSAGKIPLGTFRAKIDYGFTEAATTYGNIGIKTWIYIGEVLEDKKELRHVVDAEAGEIPQESKG